MWSVGVDEIRRHPEDVIWVHMAQWLSDFLRRLLDKWEEKHGAWATPHNAKCVDFVSISLVANPWYAVGMMTYLTTSPSFANCV